MTKNIAIKTLCIAIVTLGSVVQAGNVVQKAFDVGPTWSAHQTAPPLLYTSGGYQYVVYYDGNRKLRLAQRELGSDKWLEHEFPVRTTWATGGHALVALAVDIEGYVHVAPYRRALAEAPPAPPSSIYYRTLRPHDLSSFERMAMVDAGEPNPGYPRFITGHDGTLYFEYRKGGSGRGSQQFNFYDQERQQWETLPTLIDGQGRRSAYGGPRQGPDGRWHCFWVWRNTGAAESTHTACYMVSDDLLEWQSAAGEAVELPVTVDNKKVVVDPVKPREGLLNSIIGMGWDSRNRAVLSYHKYDESGNSQIYVARFQEDAWRIVQVTDWDFRWGFHGRGALGARIRTGGVKPRPEGMLHLRVRSDWRGAEMIVLNEDTLAPVADSGEQTRGDAMPAWQRPYHKPESDFEERPMQVFWIADQGQSGADGVSYWLRWEVGPRNRDRPVPKPWPQPTMLRVYKVISE